MMRRRCLRKSLFFIYALTASSSVDVQAAAKNACVLPCRNKGVCAIHNGRRLSSSSPFAPADERTTTTTEQSLVMLPRFLQVTGRQYCKCQKGYIGPLCEISLVLCERGAEQQCANGNQCQRDVDGSNNVYYHCECKKSKSDLSFDYSDKLCEHASTVFCTDDGSPVAKKNRQSLGKSAGGSFCVNGGTCLPRDSAEAIKSHHFGCKCPPGYSGNHCEEADSPPAQTEKKTLQSVLLAQQQQASSGAGGHWIRSFFMFLLFILGSMLLGLMALIRHGNRGRKPNRTTKTAQDRAKIPNVEHQLVESEIELS
jgi:hypothetical protein